MNENMCFNKYFLMKYIIIYYYLKQHIYSTKHN